MAVNAVLSNLQAATALAGGELIYIVQGGNSRKATLGALGAQLIEDATAAEGRTTLGLGTSSVKDTGTFLADSGQFLGGGGVTTLGRALIDDTGQSTMRTTLGLGTAAVLNSGSASGNVKTLNVDGGFTHALTAATQTIEHAPFAGLFNSAAASSNAHLQLASGVHTGPRFTQSFTIETPGGNPNGPGSSAYALWLHSQKTNYLTDTGTGEVDGQYIVVNQGINGDVGGILIGAYKVDGGTGGITGIEAVANRVNSAGTTLLSNDSVVNFLEGVGSISNGGGHGFYSEARTGTIYSGFTAMAGNDFSAGLTHFFTGALERDTTTIKFQVSTDMAVGQRLFNSVTDTSNYEAGVLRWTSNVFQIGTDSPGTGTVREFALIRDGVSYLASIGAGINLPTNIALHSAGTIFMDASGSLRIKGFSNANISDATHAVNTTNKAAGKLIYSTTSNRRLMATGATATSTWVDDAGTVIITPA